MKRGVPGRLGLVLLGLFAVNAAAAATSCNTPQRGQFDFWIGEWEVRTPAGNFVGVNRIARDYDGCVIRERYQGPGNYRGESLNAYDPGRSLWRQTWVDNIGGLLMLEGGLQDGSMVLVGQNTAVDGKPTRQRISWTPRSDGTLTQLWESSTVDGQWSVVFYGIYRRK